MKGKRHHERGKMLKTIRFLLEKKNIWVGFVFMLLHVVSSFLGIGGFLLFGSPHPWFLPSAPRDQEETSQATTPVGSVQNRPKLPIPGPIYRGVSLFQTYALEDHYST